MTRPTAAPGPCGDRRLVGEDRVVRPGVVVEVEPLDADRADLAARVGHLEARLDRVAPPQVHSPARLRPQVDAVRAAVVAGPLPRPAVLRGAPGVDVPAHLAHALAAQVERDEAVLGVLGRDGDAVAAE